MANIFNITWIHSLYSGISIYLHIIGSEIGYLLAPIKGKVSGYTISRLFDLKLALILHLHSLRINGIHAP